MPRASAPMPELTELVQDLRSDLFVRWMRRAQKGALIEWRDRKEAPGLAARFTEAGESFYQFGKRDTRYWRQKGQLPDFVKTGRFREAVLKRRPKSTHATTEVVTRLAFGGGVLNFLEDVRGITGEERWTERTTVPLAGYTYQRKKSGTTVTVAPGAQQRDIKFRRWVRGGATFADEFGRFDRDRPWIAKRVEELFMAIFRRAAVKRGRVSSSVLAHLDDVA